MNTFAKEQLFVCLEKIKEYLSTIEFDIENEDRYNALLEDIRFHSIGIPSYIYSFIESFVVENMGKYINFGYIHNFTDDEVEILSDGSINVNGKEALDQLFMGYLQEVEELKMRFDKFVESNIKPYFEEVNA